MAEVDMAAFEARFEARLRAYADIPVALVDADAVAHVAAAGRRPRLGTWPGVGLRIPALAWLLVALAIAIAAGILVGALLELVHPRPAQPLVMATETGLYLGDADGRNMRVLREDGSFLLPRWSPRGDRIAVLHGPPTRPQIGAQGGPPLTAAKFPLIVSEVLVLDGEGSTLGRFGGSAIGVEWGPPRGDGSSLLAVRLASGDVVVLDERATIVADLAVD